ncbi:hypothetical protein GA0074695_1206 [Micromonospora viridifaciens]|uniref:Uncharacterized protein n=1 Tax=Micromonospora viridifaciens TaxID=1881 RepID=A0A1C4V7R7_MICVI|nr:hypothetical protein [Micromonospora viridifaciens]SCE79815.1 hypothetical protein GA0074695_1206 [Micromonospora viridifaciens]
MRKNWQTIVGALSGVTGAVIWALATAIYQPIMQPEGFWTDSSTGEAFPQLASNNTYWPRDIRQLAILLALGGVILICRANARGVAAGAIAALGWLGADIWLDRIDVAGGAAAAWLAVGGIGLFSATAVVAARVSAGQGATARARHLFATVGAVLAAATMVVTTPWDEPVTVPDQVRVENALSMLKAGLVVMFVATMIGLVAVQLTAVRARRMAVFVGVAALAAWLTTTNNGSAVVGLIGMLVAATLAVVAAREVALIRLLPVAVVCGVALFPAMMMLYFVGSTVGSAMTSLADNPPVNGADTDLSLAFSGLVLGLLLASISHVLAPPPHEPSSLSRDPGPVLNRA